MLSDSLWVEMKRIQTSPSGTRVTKKNKNTIRKIIGSGMEKSKVYREDHVASTIYNSYSQSFNTIVSFTEKDVTEIERFNQRHAHQHKPIGWIDLSFVDPQRNNFYLGTQYGVFHQSWPSIVTFKYSGVYFLCFDRKLSSSSGFAYEMWIWFKDRVSCQFRFVRCFFNWSATVGYVTYDREHWCSSHNMVYLKKLQCIEIHNFLKLVVGNSLVEIFKKAAARDASYVDVLAAKTFFHL